MSLVRVAASVAIFTLLSAACAMAKPIVTTGETNLRKSPGTDSEVLTLFLIVVTCGYAAIRMERQTCV